MGTVSFFVLFVFFPHVPLGGNSGTCCFCSNLRPSALLQRQETTAMNKVEYCVNLVAALKILCCVISNRNCNLDTPEQFHYWCPLWHELKMPKHRLSC